MADSFSELSRKYREEMMRMYSNRRPAVPPFPPPRPPKPPECPPCPPCPPPPAPPHPPQPRGFLPVSAEPELPEPVTEEFTEPELPEPVTEEFTEPELPEPVTEEFTESELPEPAEEDFSEPVLPEYIQPETPSLPSEWQAQEDYEKRNTSEGSIYVVASAADNAYPVSGARVTIYTRIGDRVQLNYLLTTDESGVTPTVTLPAPPASLSQEPDNPSPYATCDIKIYASGYFREEARDVPIFAGITSRQEFQMIPLPLAVDEDTETIVFPSEAGGV
ncbi:MAG: hypothetical protein IJJ69_02480 [Oscillospiraceae bacterium]|nr:hypothetical protein [Oscillospiraceae bacterium]